MAGEVGQGAQEKREAVSDLLKSLTIMTLHKRLNDSIDKYHAIFSPVNNNACEWQQDRIRDILLLSLAAEPFEGSLVR